MASFSDSSSAQYTFNFKKLKNIVNPRKIFVKGLKYVNFYYNYHFLFHVANNWPIEYQRVIKQESKERSKKSKQDVSEEKSRRTLA